MPKAAYHRKLLSSFRLGAFQASHESIQATDSEIETSECTSSTSNDDQRRKPQVIPPRYSRKVIHDSEIVYAYTVQAEPLIPAESNSVVILKGLSQCEYDAVSSLLQTSGFTSSSVKVINLCPSKKIAIIEMRHPRLAEAAATIFDGMTFDSMTLAAEVSRSLKYSTLPNQDSDPAGHDGATDPPNQAQLGSKALYGSLCMDVYDEDSDSNNESYASSSDIIRAPSPVVLRSSPPSIPRGSTHPSGVPSLDEHLERGTMRIGASVRTSRPRPYRSAPSGSPMRRSVTDHTLPIDLKLPSTVVRLPSAPYSRSRRVLIPDSSQLPFITVSMRSDAQFIDKITRRRKSAFSIPFKGGYSHVTDACLVRNTAVIGFANSPFQVKAIDFKSGEDPRLNDISFMPHEQKASQRGVSCLAPMSDGRFVSGGYDRCICLWSIDVSNFSASRASRLTTLSATPFSLAYRRKDRSLLACVGQSVATVLLDRPTSRPQSVKLSNLIHQVHHDLSSSELTIFEVNHLEEQMNHFDSRSGGFGRRPDGSFGRRATTADSRYVRGSLHQGGLHFVRGYTDGVILAWDLRNVKTPCAQFLHFEKQTVAHACFLPGEIMAFGGDRLSFLDWTA